MTIRFKCDECDSVLKIKDELAGTKAKCPKCKKRFVVPQPESEVAHETTEITTPEAHTEAPPGRVAAKSASKTASTKTAVAPSENAATTTRQPPQTPPPATTQKAGEEEFDPLAFLMDDSAPGAKASAGLTSSQAPEAEARPVTDRQGRRHIVAPPPTPRDSKDSPAAQSAGAALTASANARDLLTKNAEDNRVKASGPLPEKKRRLPEWDFSTLKYQFRRGGLILILAIVGVGGVYWIAQSMLGERLPLPKLGQVSGTVMVNGEPMRNMIVVLTPVSPNGLSTKGKPLRLRDAMGLTDENGYYTAEYMVGVPGAPVGNVRLWLKPTSPQDFAKIPREYQSAGSDTREVKATGNDGRFNLELKTGR